MLAQFFQFMPFPPRGLIWRRENPDTFCGLPDAVGAAQTARRHAAPPVERQRLWMNR
jgi:hypothetical protein